MQLNVLTLWREEISMMLPEELTSGSVNSSNDDVNNAEGKLAVSAFQPFTHPDAWLI